MIHDLKIQKEHFEAIRSGDKKFELRKDDRGFSVGDKLWLWEIIGNEDRFEYTERVYSAMVTHILRGPVFGLADGWVIMSIEKT